MELYKHTLKVGVNTFRGNALNRITNNFVKSSTESRVLYYYIYIHESVAFLLLCSCRSPPIHACTADNIPPIYVFGCVYHQVTLCSARYTKYIFSNTLSLSPYFSRIKMHHNSVVITSLCLPIRREHPH